MFKKCVCTFYILEPILHSFHALINHWLCSVPQPGYCVGGSQHSQCWCSHLQGHLFTFERKKNTQIVERPTNYLIKTNKLAKLDQGARINEKNPDRVTPVQLYSRYGDSLFPDMVKFRFIYHSEPHAPQTSPLYARTSPFWWSKK